MNRRHFLRTGSLTAASAPAIAASAAVRAFTDSQPTIDTHVSLGAWPFGELALRSSGALAKKLRDAGISKAWVGHFDALLHRDMDAVNARLAEACRQADGTLFAPFGCVHPLVSGWQETLRRCHEVHRMAGIRLHPNYHGYRLDQPEARELIAAAARRGLVVQIAVSLESTKAQRAPFRVDDVDVAPLSRVVSDLAKHAPKIQLLHARAALHQPGLLSDLAAAGIHFDVATAASAEDFRLFLEVVPAGQIEFGSGAPLGYLDGALERVVKGQLADGAEIALRCHNAENLLCELEA